MSRQLISSEGRSEGTISEVLRSQRLATPDRVALVETTSGRQWTYVELDEEVDRVARGLLHHNRAGDRIAVWSPNRAEVAILAFAIPRAGMIMVPLNPALRGQELRYALSQSQSSSVIHARTSRGFDMLEHLRVALDDLNSTGIRAIDLDAGPLPGSANGPMVDGATPDAPAQILFTSGTTGSPKGAILSNRSLLHAQRAVIESSRHRQTSRILNVMPMFHIGGLSHGTFLPAMLGGAQILLERFTADDVLASIHAWRCDTLLLAPTMLYDILESPARPHTDLSSLASVMLGGAPVPIDLATALERDLGIPLLNLFGQTETAGPITQTRPGDSLQDRTETVGRRQPDVEVRIVDPLTGHVQPTGVPGEIEVRGKQTMSGYWEMPNETANAFRAGGWLRTGDVGATDERGYLTVHSRLKDMIIRGGENIYPREVEDVLQNHPAVAKVSVLGVPDARWGEQVAAVLVPASGNVDVGDLTRECRTHLAPHKCPSRWFVADQLPETLSGKVRKVALLEQLRSGVIPELDVDR